MVCFADTDGSCLITAADSGSEWRYKQLGWKGKIGHRETRHCQGLACVRHTNHGVSVTPKVLVLFQCVVVFKEVISNFKRHSLDLPKSLDFLGS